ncbi:hypothetical protein GQ42DRAFT_105076, partial [Ramicandelaber brevisporus]
LLVSLGFSFVAGIVTWRVIPQVAPSFIEAGILGRDRLKSSSAQPLAESMGIVCAVVYLVTLVLFLPFPFKEWVLLIPGWSSSTPSDAIRSFPHTMLSAFLSAILSLQSMAMLGFLDDVFNIRWRHKLFMPAIASVPLLIVYFISDGITDVTVPWPLRPLLGKLIKLGPLYYMYLSLVATFCTHTINILAGINGVEVGQSLVIALTLALNNSLYVIGKPTLWTHDAASFPLGLASPSPMQPPLTTNRHLLSLYFLLPFIAVSFALFAHNKYPSRVFVGDTYTYFAGMTFAVVGILGHFSKTLLLFMMPQVFNFMFSAPQLFRLVPCPRHRMPNINKATGLLVPSTVEIEREKIGKIGLMVLKIAASLKLVHLRYSTAAMSSPSTNFTVMNALLVMFGPMTERALCWSVILLQVVCGIIAFIVRYQLSKLLFEHD